MCMVERRQNRLINALGYAGLIPFAVTAWASYLELVFFGLSATYWFSSYSAVILVFLSGSLWGLIIGKAGNGLTTFVLVFSNAVALLAWLALGLLPNYYWAGLALLMIGYLAVLSIELIYSHLLHSGVGPDYSKMRIKLTTIVVALHGVMVFTVFLV
jgi:hypothetical protein